MCKSIYVGVVTRVAWFTVVFGVTQYIARSFADAIYDLGSGGGGAGIRHVVRASSEYGEERGSL